MLAQGLVYPEGWPATYLAKDKKDYACVIAKVHRDDIEPYYTILVLEGPYKGERQTVPNLLKSRIDNEPEHIILETLLKFQEETTTPNYYRRSPKD